MMLPITLTIAGAAALLNIWIAWRVGRTRMSQKVLIGDGGNPVLIARMRAHSNFIEYTPFFLILLGLVEMARGSETWLWIVAILYILARILHVFGMDRPTVNPLRMVGIVVSLLALLVLAIYAIAIPYLERREAPVTYAAAQAPASALSPTNGLLARS